MWGQDKPECPRYESPGEAAQTNGRPRVFVSHASEDSLVAAALVEYLEAHGFDCWVFWRDQVAGKAYDDGISEAILRADALLLVFSAACNNSTPCRREYGIARDCEKPTLPVRIDETTPGNGWQYWLVLDHWLEARLPIQPHLERVTSSLTTRMENVPRQDVVAVKTTTSSSGKDGGSLGPARAIVPKCLAERPLAADPDGATATRQVAAPLIPNGTREDRQVTMHRDSVGEDPARRWVGAVLNDSIEVRMPIGRGTMAQHYVARDHRLERTVVVKVPVLGGLSRDAVAGRLGRFELEIGLLKRVNANNIPAFYCQGHRGDERFMLMEYIEGTEVDNLAKSRHRLGSDQAIAVVRDIASALDRLSQVPTFRAHRDVKPANMMLRSSGERALLLDFSLVLYADSEDGFGFLGTPHYMSPEQIQRPAEVDVRSDLYSLGASLYEMVTGKKAYPGRSAMRILDAHMECSKPPQVGGHRQVTDKVNEILRMTLAIDPDSRVSSPRELLQLIDS